MNTKNKLTSNRKFLLTSILGVASLVLITTLVSIIYFIEAEENSHLETSTTAWANSLAQASVGYLSENQKDAQKQLKIKLKQIVTPEFINHIHIYKKQSDDTISYFTGFNKNIYYPSIPDKINQIAQLSSFRYQPNYAELIVKIQQNERIYGYLYIQSNTKYIADYIGQLTFIAVLLFLLGLALSFALVFIIQKRINTPIVTMVEAIQEISQSKNYHARIKKLPIIEFDILARNINILLTRTEKHINKKDESHQQALLQNSTLAEKVQARTNALKESNQELLSTLEKLHQFQGQLVETEKMASLGDMVAGIAHEVNTPIGLGVTASTLMNDRLKEIKQAFEDKSLKSSQLKKFLTQGEENIGIIYRNLERAAKLISSFKKVAVDQSSADTREFNMKELLEEVMLTLKAKLKKEHVKLTIDCPENLIVESKPGPINQILINLILNSIIHGFENKTEGAINISVIYLSNQLHVNYKDDGIGIDENIKTKIFEPFTTTKRGSGGSGLGLHLVYNLVTQALNGHIDFESSAGEGTAFVITFPVFLVSEQ
jgi:signal transduction histidine kinase